MKKGSLTVRMLVLLSLLALTAACGSGGGGGGGGGGSTTLATGTFTKTVDLGSGTTWGAPFINSANHMQHLYLASDIKGSGMLQSITFVSASTTAVNTTCANVVVKAGHSILTALTTTFGSNLNTGSTQTVYNGAVTIPAMSTGSTYTLTFNQTFGYNGVDNLVLDFDLSAACNQQFQEKSTVVTNGTLYAASSGAATGALWNHTPTLKFKFAGGDNTQNYGGAVQNSWPFASSWGALRTQNLYLASDINGSGPITGIAYQMHTTSVAGTYTYSMTLSHATVATLSATLANNYAGTKTTVASAVTFTVPAGIPAGAWLWVPIPDGTFSYNGTDNLIVEVLKSSGTVTGGNDVALRTSSRPGTRVYTVDATIATGTVDAYAYNIKLRFNGGSMTTESPNGLTGSGISFPFWNTDGAVQQLYRSTELGTAGTISKIACRANYDAVSESGLTYTVVMSHTTATTLVSTYATNLVSPVTVYNSSLTIPAVLKGDWYEIPLSTPFAYNGKDNLVVQIGGTGGSVSNAACQRDTTLPSLYASKENWTSSAANLTGTTENNLIFMRFTLQ